jgi:hypothetical protein
MLTRDDFKDESDIIDEATKQVFITLFRTMDEYKQRPWLYADLATALDATNNTIKAKMLNHLLAQIEEIGSGEASLTGTQRSGLQFSQRASRDALIFEAFNILYDVPSLQISGTNGLTFEDEGPSEGFRNGIVSCPFCFFFIGTAGRCHNCGWSII